MITAGRDSFRRRFIFFIFVFLEIYVCLNFIRWAGVFPGDSAFYWHLGNQLAGAGFDILSPQYNNIDGNTKGYFFVIVIAAIIKIAGFLGADPVYFFQICNGIFFSWFVIFFLPGFTSRVFCLERGNFSLLSYFFLAQIFIFFWNGYIFYPLSDFPSVILFFLAVDLTLSGIRKYDESRFSLSVIFYLLAGLCFAFAYSVRSVYLYGFFAAAIYFFACEAASGKYRNGFFIILCLLFAFCIAEIPQFYINMEKYSSASILIKNNSVVNAMFYSGIYTDRFESIMGLESAYAARFYNSEGAALLGGLHIRGILDYLNFVADYPFYTLRNTAMKLFIMMDIWHDTPYILDVFKNGAVFRNLNYLVWACGFSALFFIKWDSRRIFLVILLIAPSLTALLGHVEPRYFLAIYILCYCVFSFVFLPNIKAIISILKTGRGKLVWAAGVLVCFLFFMNSITAVQKAYADIPFNVSSYAPVIYDSENHSSVKSGVRPLERISVIMYGEDKAPDGVVNSFPIALKSNIIYKIAFTADAGSAADIFYIDFYGGEKYDFGMQDAHMYIEEGKKHYGRLIYSGNIPSGTDVFARIVYKGKAPLKIENFNISEYRGAIDNISFDSNKLYHISYELPEPYKCSLIYAVVNIGNAYRPVLSNLPVFYKNRYYMNFTSVGLSGVGSVALFDKNNPECSIGRVILKEENIFGRFK